MKRAFWPLMLLLVVVLILSACTPTAPGTKVVNEYNVSVTTVITTQPSRYARRHPPRGQEVMSCTNLNSLRDYHDSGTLGRGCGWREMTFPIDLGWRRTPHGSVREYKFIGHDGWWYYTAFRRR